MRKLHVLIQFGIYDRHKISEAAGRAPSGSTGLPVIPTASHGPLCEGAVPAVRRAALTLIYEADGQALFR
jgi:hypothetical protein